jgi:hypothetical protein
VVRDLGTADVDARLEELLIDGILYAFQEQARHFTFRLALCPKTLLAAQPVPPCMLCCAKAWQQQTAGLTPCPLDHLTCTRSCQQWVKACLSLLLSAGWLHLDDVHGRHCVVTDQVQYCASKHADGPES